MATKPIIQSIYFARLAEQGERFEDMKNHMKDVVLVKPLIIITSTLFVLIRLSNRCCVCFVYVVRSLTE